MDQDMPDDGDEDSVAGYNRAKLRERLEREALDDLPEPTDEVAEWRGYAKPLKHPWRPSDATWFALAAVAFATFAFMGCVGLYWGWQSGIRDSERLGYERGDRMLRGIHIAPAQPPKAKDQSI
jgi:hypothetical protein